MHSSAHARTRAAVVRVTLVHGPPRAKKLPISKFGPKQRFWSAIAWGCPSDAPKKSCFDPHLVIVDIFIISV